MDGVKVLAILRKQSKDTLKNKTIFIQFVLFPLLAAIMQGAIELPGMPGNFFVNLFAVMFIGMAPITAMAGILAEEKEKNTYRVLRMSDVKPLEFLTGTGACVFLACIPGSLAFGVMGGYRGGELAEFTAYMILGILISMLLGAAIGLWSRNQMTATSMAVPVMMLFAFLPMLGMFNETLNKLARLAYTQRIQALLASVGGTESAGEHFAVILVNLAAAGVLFVGVCRKRGVE